MVHFLQGKASQAKLSQIHLNFVFGFTALESSENAFFLRNQGKGVFLFLHILFMDRVIRYL